MLNDCKTQELNRPLAVLAIPMTALAETINGLYKTEVIRQQGPWRNVEEVEFATLTWVDWYNNRRLFEPIGNVPPNEKEIEYYQKLQGSAMAA